LLPRCTLSLFSLQGGRAMIASFLEQKFWVVASWMII
jgi:hypothetical protein